MPGISNGAPMSLHAGASAGGTTPVGWQLGTVEQTSKSDCYLSVGRSNSQELQASARHQNGVLFLNHATFCHTHTHTHQWQSPDRKEDRFRWRKLVAMSPCCLGRFFIKEGMTATFTRGSSQSINRKGKRIPLHVSDIFPSQSRVCKYRTPRLAVQYLSPCNGFCAS